MSDDFYGGLRVGLALGILIAGILVSLPISNSYLYKKALEECEKSLPRDEHCKVVGVKINE